MGLFSKGPKRYPQIGSTNKNGDRMFGVAMPYAAELMQQGTPKASSLQRSAVTDRIRSVKMHDELAVTFDGRYWWASNKHGRVGRLTWSVKMRGQPDPRSGAQMFDFDDGTLHVKTITIGTADVVVDIGGYVVQF
jgi:hypothetical protein